MAAYSAILVINKTNAGEYFTEYFEYNVPSPPFDPQRFRTPESKQDNDTIAAQNLSGIKSELSTWLDTVDAK